MSKTTAASTFPEFVVRREMFAAYFHPPLQTSTFHDLVNKGKIVLFKHLRGFYLLNESLKRLGLGQVPSMPSELLTLTEVPIEKLKAAITSPLPLRIVLRSGVSFEISSSEQISLVVGFILSLPSSDHVEALELLESLAGACTDPAASHG